MKPLNKKRIGITTTIGMVFAYLIAFGSAAWNFIYSQDIQPFKQSKETPVAYIEKDNVKTQYTRVEKALSSAVSGDAVYVIPGTNPTITSDCEVKSGVSLILPYSDKTYKIDDYSKYEGSNINAISNGNSFSDYSADSIKTYRKNNLTVAANKKITNKGNIYVGGILGVNGQRPCGQTTKEYCQITLEDGASIENTGNLEIYGYIKTNSSSGTGKVIAASGNVTLPMVIYDFKGGTYTSKIYDKLFPFSVFDFPNVQADLQIKYNSSVRVWCKLPSRKSAAESNTAIHEINDFYVYSSNSSINSLFKMDDQNAVITMKYSSKNWDGKESFTRNDKALGTMIMKFDGNISLHYLKAKVSLGIEILGIGAVTVNSSDYHMPLSYKFSVIVNSGTFNVNYKVKFMPGSVMTVNSGATVNVKNEASFYTSYVDKTGVDQVYPQNLEAAKCIVNGTLNISSSFGGNILTNAANAKVVTDNSFGGSVITTEMDNENTLTHQENAKGIISYNSGEAKERSFLKNTTFNSSVSESNHWNANVDDSSVSVKLSSDYSDTNVLRDITIKVEFLPSEDLFDLTKGVEWSLKGKTDRTAGIEKDQILKKNNITSKDAYTAVLHILQLPSSASLTGGRITWTITATCKAYNFSGTALTASIDIKVYSK